MEKAFDMFSTEKFTIYNADCVKIVSQFPSDSIDFSIYSPPFGSLYVYSDSPYDLGNVKNEQEFFKQFNFLIKELYRVLQPGRLMSVHCMDIPAMKEKDGFIGLKDFPGDLLRAFQKEGFIYHSRVAIWKDPLIEATRTKALGLMHKQLVKDSSMSRQGLPDYLITVRKPGVNEQPISHPDGLAGFHGEEEPVAPRKEPTLKDSREHRKISMVKSDPVYSHHVWRKYASPVWMDIRQSYTLQKESAREEKDERHIAPLQLDVIARAIELWTNPDDVVLTPFLGIGSELYQAILMGRRGIGIELKGAYYQQALRNLQTAEEQTKVKTLFDLAEENV